MVLKLEDKQSIVSEVNAVAAGAQAAFAAEYRGLTVAEMTDLRMNARKAGVYLRVVKNTLARRAVAGTPFECMQEGLTGPLVLAFAQSEPTAAARVMSDFAKAHEKLVVKLVSLSGKLLAPKDIERLAKMPTREQALSLLMAAMQAPVAKFVRTLAEPHAKLVRTVAAIRDAKQAA